MISDRARGKDVMDGELNLGSGNAKLQGELRPARIRHSSIGSVAGSAKITIRQ